MSIYPLLWAIEAKKQGAVDDSALRTLVIMADASNDADFACWLSKESLAERRGVSVATVKRHIRALFQEGFINPGPPRLVAGYPRNKRPNVWAINCPSRGFTNDPPKASRGVISRQFGGSSGDPQQHINPNYETKTGVSPDARTREAHEWDRPDLDCIHGAACVTYVDSRTLVRGPRCAECRREGRFVFAHDVLPLESA